MHCTSVIIPVRDGANYVAEAIESALLQLGPEDEVVVVWDDSGDDTGAVLARIVEPRLRVIRGPERGVSGARNVGLAASQSEFVAFLDHDDLWPLNRHQTMLQRLLDDSSLGAVFGRMRIQLETDAIPWPWIMDFDGKHIPGPNLGTGLFRRAALDEVDGFDETLRFGEDLDYFERLREVGMRYGLHDVDGLLYRRHATNCTNDQLAVQKSIFDLIRRKRNRIKNGRLGKVQ